MVVSLGARYGTTPRPGVLLGCSLYGVADHDDIFCDDDDDDGGGGDDDSDGGGGGGGGGGDGGDDYDGGVAGFFLQIFSIPVKFSTHTRVSHVHLL